MKKSRTIREAIIKTLVQAGKPLDASNILQQIKDHNWYEFKTKSELHVVKTRLNRDRVQWTFPSENRIKHFIQLSDGKFWMIHPLTKQRS